MFESVKRYYRAVAMKLRYIKQLTWLERWNYIRFWFQFEIFSVKKEAQYIIRWIEFEKDRISTTVCKYNRNASKEWKRRIYKKKKGVQDVFSRMRPH